ncbi:hypothetical protein ZWY2020_002117 [Hordeum vulgare]|nr:hypothetical protein ZWY2020_002117 [Hordeum vulgare]
MLVEYVAMDAMELLTLDVVERELVNEEVAEMNERQFRALVFSPSLPPPATPARCSPRPTCPGPKPGQGSSQPPLLPCTRASKLLPELLHPAPLPCTCVPSGRRRPATKGSLEHAITGSRPCPKLPKPRVPPQPCNRSAVRSRGPSRSDSARSGQGAPFPHCHGAPPRQSASTAAGLHRTSLPRALLLIWIKGIHISLANHR